MRFQATGWMNKTRLLMAAPGYQETIKRFSLAKWKAMDMSLNRLWGMVTNREAWRAAVDRVTKSWTRLRDDNWPNMEQREQNT